jgi:hypothetical protein
MAGAGPPTAGGTRIGYDQLKSPEFPPALHDPDGDRDVAE